MNRHIIYNSPLFSNEGISKSSREYVKQLSKRNKILLTQLYKLGFGKEFKDMYQGFDYGKEPYIFFAYGWTDKLHQHSEHPCIINYSVMEGDKIPASWVNNLNLPNIKEIWTPSKYVADMYKANGVNTKIRVIKHGINTDVYYPMDNHNLFKKLEGYEAYIDDFKFFGAGAIYGISDRDRKGTDILIKAFSEEFKNDDNVCLILKLNLLYARNYAAAQGKTFDLKEYIHRFISEKGNDRIIVLVKDMNEELLAELMNSVNCAVFPSRSEGFGLMQLESIACGVPTITTDYGATNEFSPKHLRFAIEGMELAEFDDVSDQRPPYIGCKWSSPSVKDLRIKMRLVYENYKEEKKKAVEYSKIIKNEYSWDKIGLEMEPFINALVPKPS